jgi:hypothetical protein
MGLSFLTPWAALVGLVVVLPLAAFALGERRLARVRAALRLSPPPPLSRRLVPGALVLVAALVAAAAAQPTIDRGSVARARPAAEVVVAIDTSRSMLAAAEPQSATRLARAKQAAIELREELPGIAVGAASVTDRALPHLFATTDAQAFRATVERAIGINRPPPSARLGTATTLAALESFATLNFFTPEIRSRFVVLLSDFESVPFSAARVATALREGGVELSFVRIGSETERIFGDAADAGWVPEPRAAEYADLISEATGGPVFGEDEIADVADHVLTGVESSLRVRTEEEHDTLELAPWLALAAVVPVAYVVRRRNLP